MTSRAIGLGISAVGILIIAYAVLPSFGNVGGSGSEVCDLVGSMTGRVRDYTVGKDVIDINLNMNKADCRDPSFFDGFNFSIASPPSAALLSPGEVEITAILFDSAQEQVRAHKFKVTTGFGEVEKSFSEDIKYRALEHGTYKVKVYTSWAGPQAVKEFAFTV